MLSDGTQREALPRYRREKMKILNSSIRRVGIKQLQSHTRATSFLNYLIKRKFNLNLNILKVIKVMHFTTK